MPPIIWAKTPKCAGTSIKRTYHQQIKDGDIIQLLPTEIEQFCFGHSDLWESCYKFAVIRNPFDRIISAWKYLPETKDRLLIDVLKNYPKKWYGYKKWMHFTQTQTDMLSDVDGFIPHDKLIRFEDLEAGLNEVMAVNGIQPIKIIYMNRSVRDRDYRKYYNTETRRMVERMYWMDLKLFGYEF